MVVLPCFYAINNIYSTADFYYINKKKDFIDRLHVNLDILVILILYFFLYFFFSCGANRLYVRLSHDFEQFGSPHLCAPRKDVGRSGIRTRYPRALSQPRYQ